MMKLSSEAEATFSTFFEAMREKGAALLRTAAWEAFAEKGLPNRRVEAWHYTDLKHALNHPAPLATASHATVALERSHDSLRLVTLDGAFRPDLSDMTRLPEGVAVQSLRDALAQGDANTMAALASVEIEPDATVALNAALMQDGVVVQIAPGAEIERGLELVTLMSADAAQSTFTRTLVIVGKGARATVIESIGSLSAAAAQDNHTTVVRLSTGATLDLVTHISGGAEQAVRIASLLAHIADGASLGAYQLVESGGLSRRQIFARLDGEYAKVALQGATLARDRNHADVTLVVDHAKPHGESRERFRNILDETSTGVFQGKIVVRPGAQKVDGAMQSKAILLSDGATMNNKPELEIFADDVQCGHGATIGRLDKDQLFYLTARGIPRREAESLLIEGFANEAFEGLENEELRAFLIERIGKWMSRRIA